MLENKNDANTHSHDIKQCREDLCRLWEQEELFWKARSRIKWLQGGDKNSKYFHATTNQRRARNRVTRLKDCNGH